MPGMGNTNSEIGFINSKQNTTGFNGWKRFKSTAPIDTDDDVDVVNNGADATGDKSTDIHTQQFFDENLPPYTTDMSKAGTPSPWAVFDAWGAGSGIVPPLDESSQNLLAPDSVRIPFEDSAGGGSGGDGYSSIVSIGNNDEKQDGEVEKVRQRGEIAGETEILGAYDKFLQNRSSVHLGYPYNLMYNHEELYPFMRYTINNLGDPFVASNYGVHSRQFECAVIDFFAEMWKAPKDGYWGYVTTCGTEGNLHGILLARECHPDGILYSSKETHYSVFKAARYYRMDAKSIPTLPTGEIDYDILSSEIRKNIDRPVIINVNIGTTVKGAVDNLDRILRVLKNLGVPRERFHIHCDGALFAMMLPFVDHAPLINFEKPIDSIAVSGHKMLGCPMPCGVTVARVEHVKKVEQKIEYLNSVDTTIMGSRNGQAALYLWYSLRKKGLVGIKKDVEHCMETAMYLRDEITSIGLTCRLNDLSSTVVFERPLDDALIKRWQLACEEDIAHVVVMPNVTKTKIDSFIQELVSCMEENGRISPKREDSPLSILGCSSWGGSAVQPVGNFKSE